MNSRRSYSLGLRAEKAAATRQRVLEAARELFTAEATDLTLDQVATAAGTSVHTVLRTFGNKESLILAAVGTSRATPPAGTDAPRSARQAVTQIFDDYEEIGDRVIRVLAEEHRIAGFAAVAEEGRARHHDWVEVAFAPQLSVFRSNERRRVVVALLAATDVYVWKLLRRDLGLDRKAAQATVERMVSGVLAHDEGE